jgi:hypothetical protein
LRILLNNTCTAGESRRAARPAGALFSYETIIKAFGENYIILFDTFS